MVKQRILLRFFGLNTGSITYVYLANIDDEEDFCIRKVDNSKNSELLVGLDSNNEFDKALLLFTKKHQDKM